MVIPTSRPAPRPPLRPGVPFTERIRTRDVGSLSLAIGLSALFHVVVLLLLLPTLSTPGRLPVNAPQWLAALTRPIAGQRLIVLEPPVPPDAPASSQRVVSVPDLPSVVRAEPDLPPPAPVEAPPMVGVTEPPEGALPGPAEAPGTDRGTVAPQPRTAAERLRPGEKDPRLWFLLPDEIVGLSPEQRAQLELDLAIGLLGDSMAAMADASRRATDWTYTDAQGRRWGFSPGQLHLGDITIPLPFGFSAPPNSLAARRGREDAEIGFQAGRQEASQVLRDRAAEIRRRRDAERARGDTTSAGER